MKFQRAHRSIIRSIRQVALAKDWLDLRGNHELPLIDEFEPNARSGDAEDLVLCKVVPDCDRQRYLCRRAGARVEIASDVPLKSRFLDECLNPGILAAVQPLWATCLSNKLPVYSIVPSADRNGCPVTLEKLYLPFSRDHATADYLLISLHAFSPEGRFVLNGVLCQNTDRPPLHWAVLIDPAMALPVAATRDAAELADDVAMV
ncbi:MAG: hypothetical protein EPO23_01400 [Xanthobacteraceae bacterium]|nr:MAG: hypothetical protein EPO23_01400 [Xanthobacteraceae bacterium]